MASKSELLNQEFNVQIGTHRWIERDTVDGKREKVLQVFDRVLLVGETPQDNRIAVSWHDIPTVTAEELDNARLPAGWSGEQ